MHSTRSLQLDYTGIIQAMTSVTHHGISQKTDESRPILKFSLSVSAR